MAHVFVPRDLMKRVKDHLASLGDTVAHEYGFTAQSRNGATRRYCWHLADVTPEPDELTQYEDEESIAAFHYQLKILVIGRNEAETDAMLRNLYNAIDDVCENNELGRAIEVLEGKSAPERSLAYVLLVGTTSQVGRGYIALDPLGDLPHDTAVITSVDGTLNNLPPVIEAP